MGNTYTTELPSANRIFKSSVFTMLYSDPKEALQLYNAVNGTEYKDPELLEINTLEYPICIRLSPKTTTCFRIR